MARTKEEQKIWHRNYMREYLRKHAESNRAKVREWKNKNPGMVLTANLRKYGITSEQYSAMVAAQNNRCAICKSETPDNRNRRWYIDHCHGTQKVRGLLCVHCNLMLGHAKDDPLRLRLAAEYLERNK